MLIVSRVPARSERIDQRQLAVVGETLPTCFVGRLGRHTLNVAYKYGTEIDTAAATPVLNPSGSLSSLRTRRALLASPRTVRCHAAIGLASTELPRKFFLRGASGSELPG
jgi:hypothetical protein